MKPQSLLWASTPQDHVSSALLSCVLSAARSPGHRAPPGSHIARGAPRSCARCFRALPNPTAAAEGVWRHETWRDTSAALLHAPPHCSQPLPHAYPRDHISQRFRLRDSRWAERTAFMPPTHLFGRHRSPVGRRHCAGRRRRRESHESSSRNRSEASLGEQASHWRPSLRGRGNG